MATPARAAVRRAQRERRAAEIVPHSRRIAGRKQKHTRRGPFRDRTGEEVLWHTTQPRPWRLRAQRRTANRVARLARKVNRG